MSFIAGDQSINEQKKFRLKKYRKQRTKANEIKRQ